MARMLKRGEAPRREGRNHKVNRGSARQRQLKKQTQMLRKKLQEGSEPEANQGENKFQFSPFFLRRNCKLLTLSKIKLEFNSQHF
ncbi:MAG: hypothetical protein LH660_12255 [Phormidesmis sp. CAN_BIN36]|nr:hypothetical protein [Phormidesmis sp. CAN_BIN36]